MSSINVFLSIYWNIIFRERTIIVVQNAVLVVPDQIRVDVEVSINGFKYALANQLHFATLFRFFLLSLCRQVAAQKYINPVPISTNSITLKRC
ncbi:Uncharacterized protein BM_BM249, partial [Brugia malayi]